MRIPTRWQSVGRASDLTLCAMQVIRTNTQLRRPSGILWHKLSPQKLGQIRVLQELKQRIEAETGQTLPTGICQASTARLSFW